MDVIEQLTIHFTGQWNGLNRDLSLHHNTAQGRPTKLDVEDGAITDVTGRPLAHDVQSMDGGWIRRYHIYILGAVNTDRVITIRYRVRNAIRFFYSSSPGGAIDELYWNVTGNAWTMTIDSVHGRVVLPADVKPTRVAIYTGQSGSTRADARITIDETEAAFTSTRPLYPNEGLTIGVGWPAGYITGRPSRAREQLLQVLRWIPLLIPLIVFVFAYRRWNRKGRDPAEGSYVVRYEPVDGTSPAELGTLVDNKADIADVTATLVDLAVRGYIHLTELTEEHLFGLTHSTDYQIDILKSHEEWKDLKSHERNYLEALAQSAPTNAFTVKMSDLRNRFYRFLPGIRNSIYDELVEAGYYRERPDQALAKSVGIAVGVGFLLGTITIVSLRTSVLFSPIALLVATGLSTLILIIFAQIMPARTIEGAHAREATLGFKEFLSRVEEDRFKRMITSPELFEKYLPYAMAFGVADKWANAFRDIYRVPPQWYSGTGNFDSVSFGRSIGSMSQAVASSMSSSPSGSGGGGSSGGGSGGGGGSGF